MRSSDWSSDVCASDLLALFHPVAVVDLDLLELAGDLGADIDIVERLQGADCRDGVLDGADGDGLGAQGRPGIGAGGPEPPGAAAGGQQGDGNGKNFDQACHDDSRFRVQTAQSRDSCAAGGQILSSQPGDRTGDVEGQGGLVKDVLGGRRYYQK